MLERVRHILHVCCCLLRLLLLPTLLQLLREAGSVLPIKRV